MLVGEDGFRRSSAEGRTLSAMPLWVRGTGAIAAILFTVVALRIFAGNELTPLSQPLPFFAYPFLVATLLGWAWVHYRRLV